MIELLTKLMTVNVIFFSVLFFTIMFVLGIMLIFNSFDELGFKNRLINISCGILLCQPLIIDVLLILHKFTERSV